MKNFKILLALLAVICASSSAFSRAFKFSADPGYSLYAYTGGALVASAANYIWVIPSTPFCEATSGVPCIIQALPNGGAGHHPLQSDINKIASATFGAMTFPAHDADNPHIKLTVQVE